MKYTPNKDERKVIIISSQFPQCRAVQHKDKASYAVACQLEQGETVQPLRTVSVETASWWILKGGGLGQRTWRLYAVETVMTEVKEVAVVAVVVVVKLIPLLTVQWYH